MQVMQVLRVQQFVKLAVASVLMLFLVACGGSSSSSSCASVNPNCNDPTQSINVLGADGPMANAVVELFRLADVLAEPPNAPNLLANGAVTDANGLGDGLVLKATDQNGAVPGAGPFLLRISSGASTIDTTTGAMPAIRSVSTIITSSQYASRTATTRFYATPLTALGIERATGLAGVSPNAAAVVAQLSAASVEVVQSFGFGMDTAIDVFTTAPVLDETTVSLADQQNVAAYRVAIETFSEVVEQAAATLAVTTDVVMDAVRADIKDDGFVGNAASPSTTEQGLVDETNMVDATYLDTTARFPAADGSTNVEQLLDGELAGVSTVLAGAINTAPQQADFDGDGIPNGSDGAPYDAGASGDSDTDGIDDTNDNCVNTSNPGQENLDGDALGDVCDNDADGDGADGDGSGGPSANDVDDLNDMVKVDPDGDGIDSSADAGTSTFNGPDNCPAVANMDQADLDTDLLGNLCDNDADGDGFDGDGMGGPGADPNDLDPTINPSNNDGDTVPDASDNCPFTTNQDQAAGTTPAGGIGGNPPFGALCDMDDDGFPDNLDQDIPGTLGAGIAADNCPNDANPGQEDAPDNDGVGDACDDDLDGDGIPNAADPEPTVAVSNYHFGLFYTQQSSDASNFKVATISESVLQTGGTVDTVSSNALNLGIDGLGDGNFNIASDYETVDSSISFDGSACVAPGCFAAATPTPGAGTSVVTADISPAASYAAPDLTFESGATSLAPWGASSFVGAGRVTLNGVGSILATSAEQGLAALSYTDAGSTPADLTGNYGFIDMSVAYNSGAGTGTQLVATQTRVFDATLDGAGAISTEGAMSQLNVEVGISDGSVTFTDTTLGATAAIYSVGINGETLLDFDAGPDLNAIADADGALLVTSDGTQRGYAVKLGSPTVADLVSEGPYSLEGLVQQPALDKLLAYGLAGASISFTDQGGGNITATLTLGGAARDRALFDAEDDALPVIDTESGPGNPGTSEPFTMDANGRFGPVTWGVGISLKPFEIEGFYVPGKGLILRYVESAMILSGSADGGGISFFCGTIPQDLPAGFVAFVDPNTGAQISPQPTSGFICGFIQTGAVQAPSKVAQIARDDVGNAQQYSILTAAPDEDFQDGNSSFGQGIVWGFPAGL